MISVLQNSKRRLNKFLLYMSFLFHSQVYDKARRRGKDYSTSNSRIINQRKMKKMQCNVQDKM